VIGIKMVEVDYYEVHEPIITEAKKEIQELNKDSIVRFIESLKEITLDRAFKEYIETDIDFLCDLSIKSRILNVVP